MSSDLVLTNKTPIGALRIGSHNAVIERGILKWKKTTTLYLTKFSKPKSNAQNGATDRTAIIVTAQNAAFHSQSTQDAPEAEALLQTINDRLIALGAPL